MSTSNQETEIKSHIPDLNSIRQRLETLDAKLVHERVFEHNVRYENASETLAQQGIVVRLREDSRTRLTYKSGRSIEHGIVSREELEVEVSDFDTMESILDRLGYYPYMIYEKFRTTYTLGGAEIVLDEMPYGNFVEIEGSIDNIERIVAQLELDNIEPMEDSYNRLFNYVKHHLELDFRDLTFDNFKDIDVPPSAFIPPGSIVIG